MKIKSASQTPRRYYGLHMVEGVAEYPEMKKVKSDESPRILLLENTIKRMDATFEGAPVYVQHQDVDLEKLQEEMDGVVVRSFFNAADGKHWAEFLVISDRGHEAIQKGWKLSNAYEVVNSGGSGTWHAVSYSQEVTGAQYKHLAIVPNPRYEESIVLTPEQFKEYNAQKEQELKNLTNSKKSERKKPMKFNFFKKSEVENSIDLESYGVVLSDGNQILIGDLVNEFEKDMKEKKENEGKPDYAKGDQMVKVGKNEMSVKDLVKGYMDKDKKKENQEEDKDKEKKNQEEDKDKEKKNQEDKDKEKKNQEDKDKEKENQTDEEKAKEKKNQEDKEKDKEKKNSNFEALKNAENAATGGVQTIETSQDRVARGQSRYGSGK